MNERDFETKGERRRRAKVAATIKSQPRSKISFLIDFLGDTFVDTLQRIIVTLDPIASLCTKYQGAVPLSDVIPDLNSLYLHYGGLALTAPEILRLQGLVQQRQDFITSPAHVMAYLLDPKYLGELLPTRVLEKAEAWIVEQTDQKDVIYQEMASYMFKGRQEMSSSKTATFPFFDMCCRNFAIHAAGQEEQDTRPILDGDRLCVLAESGGAGTSPVSLVSVERSQ